MTLQEFLNELESARSAFTRTTTLVLPDNPSDQNWSAADIKKKMYEPTITNYDNIKKVVSLCVELDTAISNLENSVSTLQSNDTTQDTDIVSLKGDIETINTKIAELKTYVDNNDVGEVKETLLTGILTTTLTLKNLSTLTTSVDFKELFYLKTETYSQDEINSKFTDTENLEKDYLKKSDASSTYLNKEDAKSTYLNKVDAGTTYQTKVDAETKHASQDTAILNAQNKADSAYALASGKAKVHIFDTYNDMKETLKADDGSGFNEGDSINIRAKNTADYWISKKLDTNEGEFGYYEILEDETNLSDYQLIKDASLETTHKTIPGAINENKANIETKQNITDNSLTTANKTIGGAINELKSNIDDLEEKDTSLDTEIANLKAKDTSLETAINDLDTAKQSKTDVSLNTTDKTIVGAINENKASIDTNATNIKSVEAKIPTKVSQVENDKNYIDKSVNNLENYTSTTELNKALANKADLTDLPTKVSELENDNEYINNTVSDLVNYYDKNAVDTKLNGKANPSDIPTKVSQLANDKNYIDKSVGNLENYTTTSSMNALLNEKADKTEIPTKISQLTNDSEYITASVNNLKYYTLTTDLNTLLAAKIEKSDIPTKLSAFANDTEFITKAVSGLANYTDTATLTTLLAAKLEKGDLPTKTSELTNDSGYITIAVNNLTYYYDKTTIDTKLTSYAKKTEIPTKFSQMSDDVGFVKFTDFMSDTKAGVAYAIPTTDVSNLANVYVKDGILYAKANPVPVLNVVKVAELPTVGETSTIYLVPETDPTSDNKYVEYMYVDSAWEELGRTKIDLSDYATIEYVDTQIQIVKDMFGNYYTSATLDTKLNGKLDNTANAILNTLGTNAVQKATKDSEGNVINTTYATKTEVETELTYKLDSSDFTATGINNALGTTAVNKATKDGSGNVITDTYATKTELEADLGNKVNVSDYTATGIVNKLGTTAVNKATKDASGNIITETYATKTELTTGLADKVNTSDYNATYIITLLADTPVNRAKADKDGNDIVSTYATITALANKLDSSKFTAANIVSTLGTSAVNRATADKNGNEISSTYALKTALSDYLLIANFTASTIVSKLGTTAVPKATADGSGNTITSTYATKTELGKKLDASATAIVNQLGTTAVNVATKAVQDENGNNIASTYQRSAFNVNGSVATNGTITFTDLVISDLLSAINNKQRIIFVPSDTSLASVDLNAQKTSDTTYVLKGSFTENVNSKLTNYSCQITVTSTSASGTYTSQTANDYTYTLPTASASALGGVKIGSGINISNGVISAQSYSLPTASASVLGGVKIGTGVKISNGVISLDTDYVSKLVNLATIKVGDLITMDLGNTASSYGTLHEYRVTKVYGSGIVEVVAMYEPTTSQTFGSSQAYSGSALDTYLNNTWYNTLSDKAKAAIVDNDINQYKYTYNSSAKTTSHVSYADYSTKALYANVGSRHIYSLDVEDIEQYFGGTGGSASNKTAGTFTLAQLMTLFYKSTATISGKYFWLRSASASGASSAWFVRGGSGCVGSNGISNAGAVRPAFKIDLSKIDWSISN